MSLRISYRPLRIYLAEKDISRQQLIDGSGVNKNTVGKLFKDVEVSLSTLLQVCEYLNCRVEDVVEFISFEEEYKRRLNSITQEDIDLRNEGLVRNERTRRP